MTLIARRTLPLSIVDRFTRRGRETATVDAHADDTAPMPTLPPPASLIDFPLNFSWPRQTDQLQPEEAAWTMTGDMLALAQRIRQARGLTATSVVLTAMGLYRLDVHRIIAGHPTVIGQLSFTDRGVLTRAIAYTAFPQAPHHVRSVMASAPTLEFALEPPTDEAEAGETLASYRQALRDVTDALLAFEISPEGDAA
ncbi:hypothetical protein HQQ81_21005 [Microbacteriaceae bacterium VKM Ac-2854]|nr:hypothetical protein [Microbacteriaceae bacterium VKM Ac-2854]